MAGRDAKTPSERPPNAVEAWDALEEIVLDVLGPRWRRDARLLDGAGPATRHEPLAPATFEQERVVTPPAPPTEPAAVDTPPTPPAPTGSFEWPAPGRRGRLVGRRLLVGALLALALLAAGAVGVFLVDRLTSEDGSPGEAQTGRARLAPTGPPTLTRVRFDEDERFLSMRLEFGGTKLAPDSLHQLNTGIGSGYAAVAVDAPLIRTRVAREIRDGFEVSVSRKAGRLVVALEARAGAFVGWTPASTHRRPWWSRWKRSSAGRPAARPLRR